jgi:hypothetical protein
MGCVNSKAELVAYAVSKVDEMESALAREDPKEVLKIMVQLWMCYENLDSSTQHRLDKAVTALAVQDQPQPA